MQSHLIVVNDSGIVMNVVSSSSTNINQIQNCNCLIRDNWQRVPKVKIQTVLDKHLILTEGESNEPSFMKVYRLNHKEFGWLCANIGTYKRLRWDIRIQTLVFIEWLKSKAHLEQIGRIFDMPTTTVHNSINRILKAVLLLKNKLIKLPESSELKTISRGFSEKAGDSRFFKNIVGAIDGSLVKLIVPEDQMEAYFDRHLNCSMNFTSICDHNMAIRFLFVGKTGACHDANVLKDTSIYKHGLFPPKDFIILGDSAYPNCLEPISIISPYKREEGNTLLPLNKRQFNYIHSRSRTLIERAYGRIKNMWRRIHLNTLESNVDKAADIIAACVIMNNLTLGMNENIESDESPIDFWDTEPKPNSFPSANAYRDYYASRFYN